MRYVMKQKLWSFGGEYVIRDAAEAPVYRVRGDAFSWGHQLSFCDAQDRELAVISQQLFAMTPRFEIHRNGEPFAEVVKEWSWFKREFTLDVPGPNDYTITGSFWDHEYQFERSGEVVARVSKAMWSWSDTYGVETIEGEDDISILATVVVIDLVCHEHNGG